VRLRDRDAGWKDGCLKCRVEQMTFQTTLKNIESATLTKSGRLFQIAGAATRTARDAA